MLYRILLPYYFRSLQEDLLSTLYENNGSHPGDYQEYGEEVPACARE